MMIGGNRRPDASGGDSLSRRRPDASGGTAMREDPREAFRWRRSAHLSLLVKEGIAELVAVSVGTGPEAILERGGRAPGSDPAVARSTPSGRGWVARIVLGDGTPAVLRRYRRGGMAGKLLPDLFLSARRAVAEVAAADGARAAGAPVSEPLCAIVERRGLAAALYLLSREVEGGVPLADALREASAEEAGSLLRSAARAVKQCHDAGLVHRDLNLGNILAVRSPRPGRPSADIFEEEMLVIDLDRSRMKPRGLADRERLAGLCRLARSHEKTFGRSGPWGPDPIRSLITAYASGDSSLEGRLRAMLPRQERSMRLHRLGWWLSRGR